MEDALGEDLSWFWRGWFYRSDVVDQAVDSATTMSDSAGTRFVRVWLSSPGQLPMPADLTLSWSDGTKETVRLPVEVWFLGNHYVYDVATTRELVKAEVDAGRNFPDVRRANNVWMK